MAQQQPLLSSIRIEEQQYQKQIRNTYKNYPHLFISHSSDLLHLQIQQKHVDEKKYKALVAKSNYNKFDIIAELRGSVIRYDKLKMLIQTGQVPKQKLPLLLYLNAETQFLLSPKNIGKYLFTHPLYRQNIGLYGQSSKLKGNCYIQNHYGSKLLAIASRDIVAGQQLLLQQRSYDNLVYSYNSQQF